MIESIIVWMSLLAPDHINGGFELFGTFAALHSSWSIYKDKGYSGLSIVSVSFFTLWGFWNCFYYPHLGQDFSFYAAICLAAANMLYVSLLFYYGKKK